MEPCQTLQPMHRKCNPPFEGCAGQATQQSGIVYVLHDEVLSTSQYYFVSRVYVYLRAHTLCSCFYVHTLAHDQNGCWLLEVPVDVHKGVFSPETGTIFAHHFLREKGKLRQPKRY